MSGLAVTWVLFPCLEPSLTRLANTHAPSLLYTHSHPHTLHMPVPPPLFPSVACKRAHTRHPPPTAACPGVPQNAAALFGIKLYPQPVRRGNTEQHLSHHRPRICERDQFDFDTRPTTLVHAPHHGLCPQLAAIHTHARTSPLDHNRVRSHTYHTTSHIPTITEHTITEHTVPRNTRLTQLARTKKNPSLLPSLSQHPPHATQCLKTNGIIFLGSILFMNYLLLPLIGLVSAQIGMVRVTMVPPSYLHPPHTPHTPQPCILLLSQPLNLTITRCSIVAHTPRVLGFQSRSLTHSLTRSLPPLASHV